LGWCGFKIPGKGWSRQRWLRDGNEADQFFFQAESMIKGFKFHFVRGSMVSGDGVMKQKSEYFYVFA